MAPISQRASFARMLYVLAATVVVLVGVRLAAPVLNPILFAIVFGLLCAPVYGWLLRRLPTGLALLAMFVGLLIIIVGLFVLLSASISRFTGRLSFYTQQLNGQLGDLQGLLDRLGLSGVDLSEVVNSSALVGAIGAVLSGVGGFLSSLFLILMIMLFVLSEGSSMMDRLRASVAHDNPQVARLAVIGQNVVLQFGLRAIVNLQGSLEQVESEFPQGDSGVLVSMVEEARKKAGGGLLSFGVAASFYSVYTLARTLVEALNAAYRVDETRSRWKRLLLLVAFGPALAVATIIATGSMLVGSRLAGRIAGLVDLDDVVVVLWSWLRLPAALFLLAVVLSVVYRFAPAADQPYRQVIPGATIAVIAWTVASLGFSFYLANFASYGATYGSLGAAIGLLFYLYLTASTVLLGGEVNAAVYRSPGKQDGVKGGKLRG